MKAGLVARNLSPVEKTCATALETPLATASRRSPMRLVIGFDHRALPRTTTQVLRRPFAPKWKGQIGLEAAGYEWLAALIDTMGEDKALAFARRLATQELRVQQGSSLLVQQMSAGEFNVLIDALHYQIENQKQLGAPIDYVIPDPLLIKIPAACGSQSIRLTPTPPLCSPIFSSPAKRRKSWLARIASRRARIWNGAWRKKCRTECTFCPSTNGRRATTS